MLPFKKIKTISSCSTLREVLLCVYNTEFGLSKRFDTTDGVSCPNLLHGIDYLRNPKLNKGLGFTLAERQVLGIHGLMPPMYKSQEMQIAVCRHSLRKYNNDLDKYIYLTELQDRNERLFFRLFCENIEELLPIVYTPTVGLACQKFGFIYRRPRGLYISLYDRGHVYDIIKNWTEPVVKVVVVTDGERILGLGDLGACGMGIPVGKLALYTALAGVKPWYCLPITIDVGTNNQTFLKDPLYIGLRHERPPVKEYDELLDEFMEAVVQRYGHHVLIQFEDFASHNSHRLLAKYRGKYCTFNDDIQGTAAVVLAGILSATRVTNTKITDQTFVFFGAGGAATGIADLCVNAMVRAGSSSEEAFKRIWMMDAAGLLVKSRKLDPLRERYAKPVKAMETLIDVVKFVKPTILIGASTAPKTFTPEVLKEMARYNNVPIIFALSNPTSKAECTADEAYEHTDGRCLFSSGSPFPPVKYKDRIYRPGQGNNAYIFPGVGLGVVASLMNHVSEEVFIIAAETLAKFVSCEDLKMGSLYPSLERIPEMSMQIAIAIMEDAFQKGITSIYPEPKDKRVFIQNELYNYNYEDSLLSRYEWPHQTHLPVSDESLIESGFTYKHTSSS